MTASIRTRDLTLDALPSGALRVTDTASNTSWDSHVPGWVTLTDGDREDRVALPAGPAIEKAGNGIVIRFGSLRSVVFGAVNFRLTVKITPGRDGIDVELAELACDMELASVEYPAHFFSMKSGAADSYLVVPFKQGVIVPTRLDAGFMRCMQNTWHAIADIDRTLSCSCTLNMPWFGAVRGDSGLFARVNNSSDCALHIVGNSVVNAGGDVVSGRHGTNPGERICSLGTVWLASHGRLGYPRILHIERIAGGYAAMAKRYREYAVETGVHVSLKRKIERNPQVEKLLGAPDVKIYVYTNRPNTPFYRSWSEPVLNGYSKVNTTFDQVAAMAKDLKRSGIERSLILAGGWNRLGYDRGHVTMWPSAEPAGGTAALAKASVEVTRLGYLFSLHDNYQDAYPESPDYDESYLMKDRGGKVMRGGIWDGGKCDLICSKPALELLQKNLDLVQGDISISSYYLDTTTSTAPYECFDPSHPLTRSDDVQQKFKHLQCLKDRGLVVGGEGGADWAIPVCDFFEGMSGGGLGYYAGIESDFGIAAPLFELVYHDAVVSYWQHGQPFGRDDHANHVLHDLLSGQPSSWSLVHEQWADLKPLIQQTAELLGPLHRRTAFSQMTSHEFLTPDYAVQRSRFGEGTEVIVNFGITSAEVDGIKIPPKGFSLASPGQKRKIGAFQRDVTYVSA